MTTNLRKLPKIDCHHHLWDLEKNSYPWLTADPPVPSVAGDIRPIAQSYLIDNYLADSRNQNIVKSVHVDAGHDPLDPVAETRWLQEVADRHGFPHGIVAKAELNAPNVERLLDSHKAFRNIRGIRHIVNWHPDPVKSYVDRPDLLTDSAWLNGFRLLKKYDFSFDLQLYPSQMADAAGLAMRHPDIPIILNHAGMPLDREPQGIELWRQGIKLLAAADNVSVKISGLGMVDWRWTVESIRPFVLETIETFGSDRSMFASNFPVDKLYSNFDQLYDAFDAITSEFSDDERQKLFAANASAIYRI